MATPLTGALGSITLPGSTTQTTQIFRWQGTIAGDVVETTDFDAATYHETAARTMYDLKGSCDGWVENTAVPVLTQIQLGESTGTAGFALIARSGGTDSAYTFTGILSSIRVGVPKGGLCTFTASFESSGVVTRTTYVAP